MPSKECIAIGDGFNDLCMFEYAKTSIAMKNADPIVQKKRIGLPLHLKMMEFKSF